MTLISWKERHPDRFARASERQTARLARKFATGRAGKEALMPKAREIAARGSCTGWIQVLAQMERAGTDTALMRIWARIGDKDEIDRICTRARGAWPRRR